METGQYPISSSVEKLCEELKAEGLVISKYSLSSEGNYLPEDIHWNNRDIPHLSRVHTYRFIPFHLAEDHFGVFRILTFFSIKIPLTVVTFHQNENNMTTCFSFLFYTFVVDNSYHLIAPNRTRVLTTYYVAAPKWLVWTMPIFWRFFKRNYDELMKDDFPMRERRGALRAMGYTFHSENTLRNRSLTTSLSNVQLSPLMNEFKPFEIKISLKENQEALVGKSDHLGLRIRREGDELLLFPRLCLHEGAELDHVSCERSKLKCPWHGKNIPCVGKFSLANPDRQSVQTDFHQIEFKGGTLSLSPCIKALE